MKTLNSYLGVLVLICLTCVLGCTGQAGPSGPSGASGSPAPATYQETFQNGVFPTSGYSGELDTWVQGGPGGASAKTALPYLEVNTGTDYTAYGRTLVKFDVTSLPVNAQVVSSELLLKLNPGTNVGASPVTVGLHNLSSNTDSGCHWTINATWLNYGPGSWSSCTGDSSQNQLGYINPTAISTVVFSSSSNGTNGVYRWRIDPAVVQSWLTSATNNNGLILKSEGEFGETVSSVGFYPYNDATASNHAQLIVSYQ